MRSVAVEGLFPPHRPLSATVSEKLTTRAKFIEQVLRTEMFPDNEGVVGAVVQSGKGQLITDAEADHEALCRRPEARQRLSAPPSTYLKRFYFDTITHSSPALSYLIDLVGVEQVMLGSDYPFDMGYERPAEIVAQLPGLSEAGRGAILGGNAQRLLKLEPG